MFSFIVSLFWAILYMRSPYLFPAAVSFLYFTGLQSEVLNVLITFPLGIFYFSHKLRNGQKPKFAAVLTLEFIRWILVCILSLLEFFFDAQSYALAGYSYITFITIFLECWGKDEKIQVEIKYRFYMGWTFWIIFCLFFRPFSLTISLFIHILNFMIDFRLISLY